MTNTKWNSEGTFTVNNKTYSTDTETVRQLRNFKDNTKMFAAVMHLGLKTKRIVEV